jgi:hypothetical protein
MTANMRGTPPVPVEADSMHRSCGIDGIFSVHHIPFIGINSIKILFNGIPDAIWPDYCNTLN